jgi:outer membrane protein assembly factor BamB
MGFAMMKTTCLGIISAAAVAALALLAGCEKAGPAAAAPGSSSAVKPIYAADAPAPGAAANHDWPMWGRTPNRNMVTPETGAPTEWDVEAKTNIKWVEHLGSQSYGNPVVAGGLVVVGTNNEGNRDPKVQGDASNLMIFDEKTGKFLFQRVTAKHPAGRVNDWPYMGVCSTSAFEGDLLWYCTPRCEVVCVDVEPTRRDGSPPKDVWVYDMMKEQGVFPHNMTSSSTFIHGDYIYVITGNGVDETHKNLPAPNAPSVICFEKKTGKLVWSDNSPRNGILHGEWASPAFAEANGVPLVICPLGDGWVYAYHATTGKIVWKFDSNNKETTYPTTRNELIATPVIVGNHMFIANGQDPEHGEGPGHMWCVDITKTGDVSLQLPAEAEAAPAPKPGEELVAPAGAVKSRKGRPNPNSAVVWDFQSEDVNKNGKIEGRERVNRTISSPVVYNGLVFQPDFSGYLHCFDEKTGKRLWAYDMEAAMWGSPMVADGKVYLCDEDGDVAIIPAERKLDEAKIVTNNMGSACYSSPVFANGTLYVMTREKLFAISAKK